MPKSTSPVRPQPKNLRIASPCSARWEEMKGNDWVRHCAECNLNVYNFSAMSWKEVERLIASHQGRLCARFYRRADGTVLTQDCPKGLRAVVRRISRWAGAALSALSVVSLAEAQNPPVRAPDPLVRLQAGPPAEEPQEQKAAFVVRVADPLGAVISGAEVRLINPATGKAWAVKSNDQGLARLDPLEAGRYLLRVKARAFAEYERALDVTAHQAANLNVTLSLDKDFNAHDLHILLPEPIKTEAVEAGNNLEGIQYTTGPEQQPQHDSKVKKRDNSAGMADPSPVPRTGQPHAVLQMTVSDITGVPIPAAQVRLTDQQSGKQWSGVSDSRGGFSMTVLPLGTYKLSVEIPGFAIYQDVIEARDAGRVNLHAFLQPVAMTGFVVFPEPARATPVDAGSQVKAVFRLSGKSYNQ